MNDLLTAAAVEPNRSILRSYLGKAYGQFREVDRSEDELDLARRLDPGDPTHWLYQALILRDHNRINQAIHALERSVNYNDNRRMYRSRMLLDQDLAVRSANLASIYQDAGMFDVSLLEASRAVSADYANFSAHLFLAHSYDSLNDPNGIALRFETPAYNEYLIANILAPVGAGPLSSAISQQEYSKLFQQRGFGFASRTTYTSEKILASSEFPIWNVREQQLCH